MSIIMLAAVILGSCSNGRKSSRALYKRSASGVVLVANRYYYSMNIGGKFLYFTGINSQGHLDNLTDNVDSVTARANVSYGTGFFINHQGCILTNRHIVRPEINMKAAVERVKASLSQVRDFLENSNYQTVKEYNDTDKRLDVFKEYISLHGSSPNKDDEYLFLKLESLKNSFKENRNVLKKLDYIKYDDIIVNCASNVNVAFSKSKTNEDGFYKPCNITKVSGLDDTDLAVIQLKNRTTPKGKYIFHFLSKNRGKRTMFETEIINICSSNKSHRLKCGTKLCMISYNSKPDSTLADNKTITPGTYEGNIIQEPDSDWIRYSLPVMEASSGSPILNMYGDVVCVNFAETEKDKTFNFGIPLHKIKNFLGLE